LDPSRSFFLYGRQPVALPFGCPACFDREYTMLNASRTPILALLLAASLAGCSDSLTDFEPGDVDAAHSRWLAANVMNYTFEVAIQTSWVPQSPFIQVEVADGAVVLAREIDGEVLEEFTLTIDTIWNQLLEARGQGQLNSAAFNNRGVPIEIDFGPWEVDGGVHYSVRRFASSR
jgi:hypothetical protein